MNISLHKMACTTPAIRAEIAHNSEPIAVLARRLGITEMTVRKWRSRDTFEDRSHNAQHLQTVMTPLHRKSLPSTYVQPCYYRWMTYWR